MTEAICPWLSFLPRYERVKEITEASASVGLLLATAVTVLIFWKNGMIATT